MPIWKKDSVPSEGVGFGKDHDDGVGFGKEGCNI